MKTIKVQGIPLLLFLAPASMVAALLNQRLQPRRGARVTFEPLYSQQLPSKTIDSAKYENVNSNFETWFSSISTAEFSPSIRHNFFGNLRGLAWNSNAERMPSKPVVKVPLSVVLQSDIQQSNDNVQNDWDANLAHQLWKEYCLRDQSKINGYIAFLTYGEETITGDESPPSTAPNALRHWKDTPDALAILDSTPGGKKLLSLEQSQDASWKTKFGQLIAKTGEQEMSWEQFQWAMEVVHSRAFRGNFGSSNAAETGLVSTLLTGAAPTVGAALAGWLYMQNNPNPDSLVLGGLAVAATIPLGLNLLGSSSNPPTAVLLPFIDSANHDENADSFIEYDPLSECFQLRIGPRCLVQSPSPDSDSMQLCISYGKRSDPDLLLNYGFLPNVPCADDSPVSVQRRKLAEEFIRRNN